MAFEIEHGRGFTAEELAEAHKAATSKSNRGTIAAGTLRKNEIRDYAGHCFDWRTMERAPAGTLKYREFCAGVSFEPRPLLVANGDLPGAMAEAIRMLAPDWSEDIGSPVRLVR